MFYIKSADRLQRTAPWVEQFEGGVDKLRKILIDDELGICQQLETDMDALVGTFECEWTRVVNEPERRKQFRQHVNTSEATVNVEKIKERAQTRAADWPKEFPPVKMNESMIPTPKSEWTWQKVALLSDLTPTDTATTSCSVKIGDSQIAIFNVPNKGLYATQQMCPHKRAFVLDHGIIGDDKDGNVYVACPLHKRRFNLEGGDCLNDPEFSIIAFDVKEVNGDLYLRLPPSGDLDEAIGTSKWMVKQATADVIGRGAATALSSGSISLVGPDNMQSEKPSKVNGGACSNHKLEW
jgi:nitrite reductase (NAD(P)H)